MGLFDGVKEWYRTYTEMGKQLGEKYVKEHHDKVAKKEQARRAKKQ